jgi:pilus assembly protein CpaF
MSLLERIQKEQSVEVVDNKAQKAKKTQVAQQDPYATIKAKIHSKIIEEIKSDSLKDLGPNGDEIMEEQITAICESNLNEENSYITKNERQKILS